MSGLSVSAGEPARPSTGSGSDATAGPRQVINVAVLAESELGSEAQRERRKRILDATLAIASKGGYEAVQMRAVAERADVAVGTLYRYFPSKVHLLVSALGREFERIDLSAAQHDGGKAQPVHAAQPLAHRGNDAGIRVRRRIGGR
jgi:AcrR family transcriptional regulator